ncbi:MAG: hypothetical protein C4K49_06205 [Candidatus Thorarchaeota archaeon]|nr:MAG: hypothetical protein C4K49_06205 [Candidatus Thorarchaeota archaeon]
MSTKRRLPKTSRLAFVSTVCDMSRRGDIDAVIDTFEGYWRDKTRYPWHNTYVMLEKYWALENPETDVSETLLLLRDGVFGALGLHSLSLPIEMSTQEILRRIVKGRSWKDSRRSAREYLSQVVSDMIEQGQIAHLIPSALKHDGLGFLLPSLEKARLDEFRNARPKITRGKLDLRPLSKSVIGRTLLRQLSTKREMLAVDDPQVGQAEEAYEHMLLDLEVGEGVATLSPEDTLQVTISGEPLEETTERKQVRGVLPLTPGVQTNLTEYVGSPADTQSAEMSDVAEVRKREKRKKAEPNKGSEAS